MFHSSLPFFSLVSVKHCLKSLCTGSVVKTPVSVCTTNSCPASLFIPLSLSFSLIGLVSDSTCASRGGVHAWEARC